MSGKTVITSKPNITFDNDPLECPFREFRDNELQIDVWGLGTAAFRTHTMMVIAKVPKSPHELTVWVDEQIQPVPRSVRAYLHGWIRAEELAMYRWNADVVVFDENDGGKMLIADTQLSHAQVLFRSSFCRRVLCACFMLELADSLIVEHTWDYFTCSFAPEGWRPKYHIYSPGLKAGGGASHKPVLSKNGCYLVRLFYLGTWRCVWVSDQVPVDTSGSPLLPFSPLLIHPPPKPGSKAIPQAVIANVVYLWPLLLTKALLKLAAPDMNSDEDTSIVEDEEMNDFDIMHTLTGCMNIRFCEPGPEELWNRIVSEVPLFTWDDDDETQPSTIKSKSTKKPTAKDAAISRRTSLTYAIIQDTKDLPPYHLPGITPGHQMSLLITMARDLPLKKPLPEPEIALWKYYRWIDWARSHGLYEAYECPRTKFLKVNGLMKLSYAPHLLDVLSTESITFRFIEEHVKSTTDDDDAPSKKKDKKAKDQTKSQVNANFLVTQAMKEELREWIQFLAIQPLVSLFHILCYPSTFNFTSAGSNPPIRITKTVVTQKVVDIPAPKSCPMYLQLDGPEKNKIRMSLSTLHPRVLFNTGTPVLDYIESANLVLERFEWFKDTEILLPRAYIRTRGYESFEIDFEPGRHFFRVWVHSRMNWHIMLISESNIILGTRDLIQGAAVRECPWASKFLLNLGAAFTYWSKITRENPSMFIITDRDFFSSYLPDLEWDENVVGHKRSLLHWMFRQALQAHLTKRLLPQELREVCIVLRKYFCDPDFGLPPKPKPPRSVREIANLDICDCVMPEVEEIEGSEEQMEEMEEQAHEENPLVDPETMNKLLQPPTPPILSLVCELATEELPCGILKDEREKMIKKHEAAIVLQAYWRGTWARKCLKANVGFTNDVTKYLQEQAFGSIEALSNLMNEFFGMFPGTNYAYSVSSALCGVYGLQQHTGITPVTYKCKWVPFFQGVFYCHVPVKVHFDVHSSIPHSTMAVYDNDTGNKLPQAYNTHITFDIEPNCLGYTVIGHGTLNQAPGINYDAHWQLTVMSCIDGAFHVCDNDDPCREQALPHTYKMHLDEIFLPNRRNILGGIQISVTKHESVSFRAAASSPDLEMVATLRTISPTGDLEELVKCSGKGEIFWPYIRLEQSSPPRGATSLANMSGRELTVTSARSLITRTTKTKFDKSKNKSITKMKTFNEPKQYSIEVVCPMGWPLTLVQWRRVDEVRNSRDFTKIDREQTTKKTTKEKEEKKTSKPGSAKDKDRTHQLMSNATNTPQPGDACIELECAWSIGGGATGRRDDDRDIEFANARRSWDAMEPGRNQRGAQIRKAFRTDFLEVPPPAKSESYVSASQLRDEMTAFEGTTEGEEDKTKPVLAQGPTPVTDSEMLDEITVDSEEEVLYLTMPDQLRDKFIPLNFLPFCMKERNEEESILVSPDMVEAAKKDRHARIEAALERMRELQLYNEEHVLGRQKFRCQALEKLFVDASLCPELEEVMIQREDAIAQEVLERNLSAAKKKTEGKTKK